MRRRLGVHLGVGSECTTASSSSDSHLLSVQRRVARDMASGDVRLQARRRVVHQHPRIWPRGASLGRGVPLPRRVTSAYLLLSPEASRRETLHAGHARTTTTIGRDRRRPGRGKQGGCHKQRPAAFYRVWPTSSCTPSPDATPVAAVSPS